MDKTLFELSDEIIELDALLDTVEETDVEGEQAILEGYLSTLQNDLERKLDDYCLYISELEARAAARKTEADRVLRRGKVDAGRAAWLEEMLKRYFATNSLKTVETRRYRITLATNGGRLPLIVDPDMIQPEYMTEVVSHIPDTEKIREVIEAGGEVEGATLGERESHLLIK